MRTFALLLVLWMTASCADDSGSTSSGGAGAGGATGSGAAGAGGTASSGGGGQTGAGAGGTGGQGGGGCPPCEGTCVGDTCTPTPETLVEGGLVVRKMVVDASHVYYLDDVSLSRLPKTGGASEAMTAVNARALTLAFPDDGYVYVADEGDLSQGAGSVVRVDRASGAVSTLVTGLTRPQHLAADSTHLYTIVENSMLQGLLVRAPIGGGAGQFLGIQSTDLAGLAVDATHLYWTTGNDCEVRRMPKTGTSADAVTIFPGPCTTAGAITLTTDHFVFRRGAAIQVGSKADPSSLVLLGGSASDAVWAFTATDDRVFYLFDDARDALGAIVLQKDPATPSGFDAVPLGVSTGVAGEIAADATHVYFTDADSGRLLRTSMLP